MLSDKILVAFWDLVKFSHLQKQEGYSGYFAKQYFWSFLSLGWCRLSDTDYHFKKCLLSWSSITPLRLSVWEKGIWEIKLNTENDVSSALFLGLPLSLSLNQHSAFSFPLFLLVLSHYGNHTYMSKAVSQSLVNFFLIHQITATLKHRH